MSSEDVQHPQPSYYQQPSTDYYYQDNYYEPSPYTKPKQLPLGPTPPASPNYPPSIQHPNMHPHFDSSFGLRGLMDEQHRFNANQNYIDLNAIHPSAEDNVNSPLVEQRGGIEILNMESKSPLHQASSVPNHHVFELERPASTPILSNPLHLPHPPSSLFIHQENYSRYPNLMDPNNNSPRLSPIQYYDSSGMKPHLLRYPTPPPRSLSTPLYPQSQPYQKPSRLSQFLERDIDVELALQGVLIRAPFSNENSPEDEKYVRVYKCPRQFCSKVYKNSNGLKYHLERGVCELDSTDPDVDTSEAAAVASASNNSQLKIISKPYWCRVPNCGKKYKNLNGLKYHARVAHQGIDFSSMVKGHFAHPDGTENPGSRDENGAMPDENSELNNNAPQPFLQM